MRFGKKMVSASVTFSYIHPVLHQRMVAKVGQILAPSFKSIADGARTNMEYDKV